MEVLRPPVEELAQVQRITEHHLFRGAESLCRLLRFLVEHAINARSEPVREFDIATEVFKRRHDFDPQSDSIVRVQIGRLRARLTRYYFEAGTSDPIVFEIPRGGYSLSVSYRERPHAHPESTETPPAIPVIPAASPSPRPRAKTALIISLSVIAAIVIAASVIALRKPSPPTPLAKFWEPFTSVPLPPYVIYSNQVRLPLLPEGMVQNPVNRTRALYTGIGEVMAAVDLTHLFDRMGHEINFRGEAGTPWEDIKNSNLIFIGTAKQSLKAIGNPQRFMLRHYIPDNPASPLVIIDLKPEKGHPALFGLPTACCQPPDEEYALLMFSPGVTSGRVALTMFGTSTLGTQAAVEFVCDANSVTSLLKLMPQKTNGRLPFFEAVLRVRIRDNAPISSTVASFYLRTQQ